MKPEWARVACPQCERSLDAYLFGNRTAIVFRCSGCGHLFNAQEGLQAQARIPDLEAQLESLFDQVWKCEREWNQTWRSGHSA